jgi:hypothetical protein
MPPDVPPVQQTGFSGAERRYLWAGITRESEFSQSLGLAFGCTDQFGQWLYEHQRLIRVLDSLTTALVSDYISVDELNVLALQCQA